MDVEHPKEKTISYILKRKCQQGGFCFYRLEEPNGSDTYYALSTLNLLGEMFKDEKTMFFLKNMQKKDGSYSSVQSAYYSIKGLKLLKQKPKYNPWGYIQGNIKTYNVANIPVDAISIFKPLYYLTDLCSELKIEIDEKIKNNIVNFVLHFKNKDNGFGFPRSTLLETSEALSILNNLSYQIDSLKTIYFIKKCENPLYGFSNMPNTAPSFIEHIHAGLTACMLIKHKPRYLNACAVFIRRCQNRHGGFSRASSGILTLENTYHAVHSLTLLSTLKNLQNKTFH